MNGTSKLERAMALASIVAAAALVGACSKDSNAAAQGGGEPKGASQAQPAAHVSGDNYKVDTSSTCAGGDCTATIRLEATGTYHINDTYPYKFKAENADGVTFKGTDKDNPNVFSRQNGDFAKQAEKVGVLTVRFSAQKPVTITGVYKMSVCTDANCELEQPPLAIDVRP